MSSKERASQHPVSPQLLQLLERSTKLNHRIIIGINGKVADVAHHIHALLSRQRIRPNVLWAYDRELGFKGPKITLAQCRKSAGGTTLDNFASFIVNTPINYVLHSESERVLGTTTDFCVLQDFAKIKANTLASIIESVNGGGIILLPIDPTDSIYMQRVYRLLSTADNYLIINPQLNILQSNTSSLVVNEKENKTEQDELHQAIGTAVETVKSESNPLNPLSIISANSMSILINQCKTQDQIQALLKMAKVLDQRTTFALTADRGRGKSAALGLAVSLAIIKGMNDVLVVSPHLSNVQTLFQFIIQGLMANGYKDQIDYHVNYSRENKRLIEKIVISKTHYQSVRFSIPAKPAYSPSLLVVDEAAAIPLTILSSMIGMYPTLLSSTTAGYEGTGRALALKFFKSIKPETVHLEEPIRYGKNDPVEKWLNLALSLSPEIPAMPTFPKHEKCQLFAVNKSLLFSGQPETEKILSSLTSILLSGHYKNSPNDIQLLADNPKHTLLTLISAEGCVLGVLQTAQEGSPTTTAAQEQAYKEMRTEEGNLIPWSLSQYYLDLDFFKLAGLRIVRVAIHPEAQSMGYGSHLIKSLINSISTSNNNTPSNTPDNTHDNTNSSQSNVLFQTPQFAPQDYLGVSYGVTLQLLEFWKRQRMSPVYLKHTICKTTGEHSLIMLHPFTPQANTYTNNFSGEFTRRFIELLPGCFRSLSPLIAIQLITPLHETHSPIPQPDLYRMKQFSKCSLDLRLITDLLPGLAKNILLAKKQQLSLTQKIIFLALGLQHQKPKEIERYLSLTTTQIRMLLAKALYTLSALK
ncbi:N-acetyltransferase 10 [Nematocida homosporus]|uniref:N-acetyltransferase 10 n=1 Tax=Nematocida homosporus TaxID=1912981 RepID=UPI00221FE829|nr:N-acetyltransferase 10 [Nematocida homosporus]KAI5187147.1 N-acetyltransferase 10 [Nematocida homosporus]